MLGMGAGRCHEMEGAELMYREGAGAESMCCGKGIQARAIRPLERVPILDVLRRICLVPWRKDGREEIFELKWPVEAKKTTWRVSLPRTRKTCLHKSHVSLATLANRDNYAPMPGPPSPRPVIKKWSQQRDGEMWRW